MFFYRHIWSLGGLAIARPRDVPIEEQETIRRWDRRWDSEHELSLPRHRTRTTKYTRLVHKFRHRSTRLYVRTQVYQIQWNNAMQRPLRRSKSFKVTDFDTNRKLIYDFLLVINTNLIAPFPSYGWLFVTFSPARGECLTLTLSQGPIPYQYRHKWYIAKNILWSTFPPQKVPVYLQPILRNPPRIRWNYASVRGITTFKVIQGNQY